LTCEKLRNYGIRRTRELGTQLKQLLVRESQQELSRKLKSVFRSKGGGVKVIEAPTEAGTWELQTSKENIEKGCIDKNIRRFTQANHTPSLQIDQYHLLGWTGNTATAKDLLHGIIDQRLHHNIRNLAAYLKTQQEIFEHPPIKTMISVDDYTKAWKHC
jgi:hypothetical protein